MGGQTCGETMGYEILARVGAGVNPEMMHAERLAERILFLKGEVELEANAKVVKINEVQKMLETAESLEEGAIQMYNGFANECAQHGDSVTKKLFEDLITDEERHFDNFDTQEDHLRKFGEQFLALQSLERSRQISTQPPSDA